MLLLLRDSMRANSPGFFSPAGPSAPRSGDAFVLAGPVPGPGPCLLRRPRVNDRRFFGGSATGAGAAGGGAGGAAPMYTAGW